MKRISEQFFEAMGDVVAGLLLACVNLMVGLVLVCTGLLLGVTISLLAWLRSISAGGAARRAKDFRLTIFWQR